MSRQALEAEALLDVRMRLAVELGRVRMPLAHAVALADGELIDLDRNADEPVEVYVNGLHFGTGRLHVVDGEWALRLEHVDAEPDGSGDGVEHASSAGSAAFPATD